jgi:hypothetical protein
MATAAAMPPGPPPTMATSTYMKARYGFEGRQLVVRDAELMLT